MAADVVQVPFRHTSTPCPHCAAPVDPGDSFCPNCGVAREPRPGWGPSSSTVTPWAVMGFRCENCGAELRCDPDHRTTICPFCAAPYVIQRDRAETNRQDPEFVIGFAIAPVEAERIYRDWLRQGGLFRPADLFLSAEADGLRGIYLPFWSFSARSDSEWSAQIGEYWYRTETYTERDEKGNLVTRTRQVQETEWWPLKGRYHAYHSFYLVSASRGLPQEVFKGIEPFQLLALKRYAPHYLAGWLSEEYTIDRETAYDRSAAEFHHRERLNIASFLPGDTHSDLEVHTQFSQVGSDLILLPVYLRSYRYRNKLYRILINGQTGKISGQKPISGWRIATLVGSILLALVLIYLLIVALGGRG